jgi:lipoate-protein ligase A
MHTHWRFLDTGAGNAAMNMALDEALLLTHEAGTTPPTLRVYSWSAPTLSLGYAQSTATEVDRDACQRLGIIIVRRPTGGRAVLHDHEVTYSVVMPTALSDSSSVLTEQYRQIGLALATALRHAGLTVHLERPHRQHPSQRSPACFAALSRYELSATGRKLVGSAQKRRRHALLQHGSIPLTLDRQRLFACLRVPPAQRAALIAEASTSMAAIHEVATAAISPAVLHQALRVGFATIFGVEVVPGTLLPEEQELAQELYTTKYTTSSWNLDGAAAWRQAVASRPGVA